MSEQEKALKEIWPLLEENQSFIFGYLKSAVGNADIARDLFQDVYLSALRQAANLDKDRSLKNWLITVARNRLINYYRDSRTRHHDTIDDQNIADEATRKRKDERIQKALQGMPERQRDIFILKEWHGLDHAQLAAEKNISESAVNSLLARARKQFEKNYLLQFFPPGFEQVTRQMDLNDLTRFVNMFDDTDDILRALATKEQSYFTRLRSAWDRVREEFFSENHLDQVFPHIGSPAGFCLDLGSASGFVSLYLQRKGLNVVALDLNSAMLQEINRLKKTLLLDTLAPIRAHAYGLPFKRRTFTNVFCTLVLHHISRPEKVIKEIARCMTVGGKLVLFEFDRHRNQAVADIMHDLWLGFEPGLTERWAKRQRLHLQSQESWPTMYDINVYYQIFEKR